MERSIERYKAGFETADDVEMEFDVFAELFSVEFSCLLKKCGAERFDINVGEFYVFGFFNIAGRVWYFATDDVRYKISGSLLVRRAKNFSDYKGEENYHVKLNDAEEFKIRFSALVKGV